MNFINSISAHKHQQVRRWFLFSSTALGATIMGIAVFQTLELYELHGTHKQLMDAQTHLDALQPNCTAKEILQQKKSSLAQLKTHISSCTAAPCSPHDTLCMLTKLSALPIILQSVQLHPKGIEMAARVMSIEHATLAIEKLKKETRWKQLEIISITHESKGLLFKLKGMN